MQWWASVKVCEGVRKSAKSFLRNKNFGHAISLGIIVCTNVQIFEKAEQRIQQCSKSYPISESDFWKVISEKKKFWTCVFPWNFCLGKTWKFLSEKNRIQQNSENPIFYFFSGPLLRAREKKFSRIWKLRI